MSIITTCVLISKQKFINLVYTRLITNNSLPYSHFNIASVVKYSNGPFTFSSVIHPYFLLQWAFHISRSSTHGFNQPYIKNTYSSDFVNGKQRRRRAGAAGVVVVMSSHYSLHWLLKLALYWNPDSCQSHPAPGSVPSQHLAPSVPPLMPSACPPNGLFLLFWMVAAAQNSWKHVNLVNVPHRNNLPITFSN